MHIYRQPHGNRSCVPARSGEPFKRRLLGCGLVEMERLRIELSGKALDILSADNSFWALEAHAHCEIFKPFDH